MAYRGKPYWESETPEEARAGNVLLRWFPKAGKLQAHRLFRNDAGEERTAAVVTLDADALTLAPDARALLSAVLREGSEAGGEGGGRRAG